MLSKPICKFYQKGYCRNGDRCKFLHGESNDVAPSNRIATQQQFMSRDPSSLAKEIRDDLDEYKYIQMNPALTAYGTGEFAINNLIAGRDLSPDELRIQYMEAVQTNKLDEFIRTMELKKKDMEYCINEIRKKDSVAARYQQVGITHRDTIKPFIEKSVEQSIAELQNTLGNNSNGGAFGSAPNPFGASANPFGASAFGNSASGFGSSGFSNSGLGNSNNTSSNGAFGSSGFGNAGTNGGSKTESAFGSSGFGSSGFGNSGFGSGATGGAFGIQKTTTGFGSAGFGLTGTSSAFGSSGTGAFSLQLANAPSGQSTLGNNSGFNNTMSTSAFGSSGFGSSGFGAAKPISSGAFGSSGFGSSGFGQSSFGSSVASTTQSAFGQSNGSSIGQTPAIGGLGSSGTTSAFGAPAAPQNQTQSAFGTSNANTFPSATQSQINAFGQPATAAQSTSSVFGQASTAAFGSSGFGSSQGTTTSAFGQAPAGNTNPFGSLQQNSIAQFGGSSGGAASVALDKFDPEVSDAFLAANFELGKVPDVPPPPQVC